MLCSTTLAAMLAAALLRPADAAKTIAGVPVLNYDLIPISPRSWAALWRRWVVYLGANSTNDFIAGFCEASPARCALAGHPGDGGVPFIEVFGTERDLAVLFRRHQGRVVFAEPNLDVHVPPDLPEPAARAGRGSLRQASASWGLDRIGVPREVGTGRGVHIYMLDTGIRATHEDFGGRAVPTLDVSGGTVNECQGQAGCALDGVGHGTHCAGTAGGARFGVAKRATLHAVKVLSDSGSGPFSWAVAALDWVATKGEHPAVASMSLGGLGRLVSMERAIRRVIDRGVTVVVAAGNENDDADKYTPAFVRAAITVGATDSSNTRAHYSNYGAALDIFAPGSEITSAWITSDSASKSLSGTSMACPHVSGAAALLLESHPAWTPDKVASQLTAAAAKGVLHGLHSGDPNALLSVARAPRGGKAGGERRSGGSAGDPDTKILAGVPVLNYHLAQGREAAPGEAAASWKRWLLFVSPAGSKDKLADFCNGSTVECRLAGHPSDGGIPFVEVHGTESELEVLFTQRPGEVEFAEPNVEAHIIPGIPAPPMRSSTRALASWGLDRIRLSETALTGEGVHIYVLDTGIRATHTDFGGRAVAAVDLTSGTLVECAGIDGCAVDHHGHGTHCAGIAAGQTFGVANKATIHAVKVLDDEGRGYFSWSVAALDWVATQGQRPAVVSMSLGGPGTLASVRTAITAVTQAGVTVVVAAGNEDADACEFTPAFVPEAITVAATTPEDALASYSNFGTCLDILAPGSSIVSDWITSDEATHTLSGTSMACPHVAGAVALSLQSNPSWTPAEVTASLLLRGGRGVISGLHKTDPDIFLLVAASTAGASSDDRAWNGALFRPLVVPVAVGLACAIAGGILGFRAAQAAPSVPRQPSQRALLAKPATLASAAASALENPVA